jgi:sulfur-carrier protein adenylyltransferase/sulfurtransferase
MPLGCLKAMRQNVPEVSPRELRDLLMSDQPPVLVDVREEEELEISHLPFAHHIPLGELPDRYEELDPEDDLVIYCRSGVRSANATAFLRYQGYKRVRNLSTGINGWADDVDPAVEKY